MEESKKRINSRLASSNRILDPLSDFSLLDGVQSKAQNSVGMDETVHLFSQHPLVLPWANGETS